MFLFCDDVYHLPVHVPALEPEEDLRRRAM